MGQGPRNAGAMGAAGSSSSGTGAGAKGAAPKKGDAKKMAAAGRDLAKIIDDMERGLKKLEKLSEKVTKNAAGGGTDTDDLTATVKELKDSVKALEDAVKNLKSSSG